MPSAPERIDIRRVGDTRNVARSVNYASLPSGCVDGYAPISVDRFDVDSQAQGCAKRIIGKLPSVSAEELANIKKFTQEWVTRNLKPLSYRPDFEKWLEKTDYTMVRKEQLRVHHRKNHGSAPSHKERRRVKQFVKLESYPEFKHARTINSRSDAFKAWFGPWARAMEEVVYSHEGDVRFIKHVPVPDRPALLDMLPRGQYLYNTDFISYEHHFTKEIMESIEFVLYKHMCPCMTQREMEIVLSTLGGFNHITSRKLRAKVKARRMSGEMVTSLGNGFTNMILALYIAQKKGGRVVGFVEGDDGLLSSSVEMTKEDYEACGFQIKMKQLNEPGEASFCGMLFGPGRQIVRSPREFLAKFAWTHSQINAGEAVKTELLHAKALSTLYETPACPIVSELALSALQDCFGTGYRFEDHYGHPAPPSEWILNSPDAFKWKINILPETREFVNRVFDISVDVQLRVEELIRQRKLAEIRTLLPPGRDSLTYWLRYVAEVG